MDKKRNELRHLTPRQIAVYRDRVAISDSDYELIPVHTGDLRALLAELEAKDKRIAELERSNTSQDDHINQQQDRIDSLEKTNAGLGRRLGDAEKRLATPVRLLGEMLVHDWEHSTERQATFQHRKIAWDARLAEDKKAILAAGFTFTVEGDK